MENSINVLEMGTAVFMWFRFPAIMKECDYDSTLSLRKKQLQSSSCLTQKRITIDLSHLLHLLFS